MDIIKTHLLLSKFNIPAGNYSIEQIPTGYIHKSYKILQDGKPVYVLQQLSKDIFPNPDRLYQNFNLAVPYLRAPNYESFQWIDTKEGASIQVEEDGLIWRLLSFIPNSRTLSRIENSQQAYECGRLLGLFHQLLSSCPNNSFQITIPNFHNLNSRVKDYEKAKAQGLKERLADAEDLLGTIENLQRYLEHNKPDNVAERICHNDSKLSNVLFHSDRDIALCYIDLDTLMPGFLYYDFGDLCRTVLDPKDEESKDPLREHIALPFLSAVLEGFNTSGVSLTNSEVESLSYGMILMPFLHGIRALTDHFLGDPYYQVSYPNQNMIRAKNLISYAQLIHSQIDPIQEMIVDRFGFN